jgi:hypothetical protein
VNDTSNNFLTSDLDSIFELTRRQAIIDEHKQRINQILMTEQVRDVQNAIVSSTSDDTGAFELAAEIREVVAAVKDEHASMNTVTVDFYNVNMRRSELLSIYDLMLGSMQSLAVPHWQHRRYGWCSFTLACSAMVSGVSFI